MTIAIVHMGIGYLLVSSHPYPWKRIITDLFSSLLNSLAI